MYIVKIIKNKKITNSVKHTQLYILRGNLTFTTRDNRRKSIKIAGGGLILQNQKRRRLYVLLGWLRSFKPTPICANARDII